MSKKFEELSPALAEQMRQFEVVAKVALQLRANNAVPVLRKRRLNLQEIARTHFGLNANRCGECRDRASRWLHKIERSGGYTSTDMIAYKARKDAR
jgi:hypothetical protein